MKDDKIISLFMATFDGLLYQYTIKENFGHKNIKKSMIKSSMVGSGSPR